MIKKIIERALHCWDCRLNHCCLETSGRVKVIIIMLLVLFIPFISYCDDFPICTELHTQWQSSIAWNGTKYLSVWSDARNGSYYDIYARTVDSDQTLGPEHQIYTTSWKDHMYPDVAWNGENYLIAFERFQISGTRNDIYGMKVDSAGSPFGSVILICTAASNQEYPKIASDGTDYLVVWQDKRSGEKDIYARLIEADGTPGAEIQICIESGNQTDPSIAFDGTHYLVVWADNRSGNWEIYNRIIDPDGTLGVETMISTSPLSEPYGTAVAWNGVKYLVVWDKDRDIYGRLANMDGTPSTDDIVISNLSNSQYWPAVSWDRANYIVVWNDYRGDYDIYAQKVSGIGNLVGGEIAICTASNSQFMPAVASNGNGYFVTWNDYRNGSPSLDDIYGTFGGIITDVDESNSFSTTQQLSAFPNPFGRESNSIQISFTLPKASFADVKIYNIRGELVKKLYSGIANEMIENRVTWDGRDENGRLLSPGIYFYQLKSDCYNEVKKIVIVR